MNYDPSPRWLAFADRYRRRVLPVTVTASPRRGSPQEVAVHEAGHAVVAAAAMGELACLATIDPAYMAGAAGLVLFGESPPPAGSRSLAAPGTPFDRAKLADWGADAICITAHYLAGYLAVDLLFLNELPDHVVDCGRHDELAAHRMLSIAFDGAERRYAYGAAFALAGEILLAHWVDVELLALALLRHRTLVGAPLRALLTPVLDRELEARGGIVEPPPPAEDLLVVRRLFCRAAEAGRRPADDCSGRGAGWRPATALPMWPTPAT